MCKRIKSCKVRYVPNLKRNLFSVDTLEYHRCVVKIENGTIKIIRGAMTLMKGTMKNGLYVLEGHTTNGEAVVVK